MTPLEHRILHALGFTHAVIRDDKEVAVATRSSADATAMLNTLKVTESSHSFKIETVNADAN